MIIKHLVNCSESPLRYAYWRWQLRCFHCMAMLWNWPLH